MKHTYTQNHLIRFYYKECDLFERLEMEFAMDDDSTLMQDYHDVRTNLNELPKVTFSPRKSTIDAILAYSAAE